MRTSIFLQRVFFSFSCFLIVLVFSDASASANQDVVQFQKLNRQIVSLYKARQYAAAVPFAQRALQLMDHDFRNNPVEFAQALNNLGELKRKMGDVTTAEAMFLRSLKFSLKFLPGNHPLVAILLNNLALLYENQGQYQEARSLYERSLKIRREILTPNHPAIANLVDKLSVLNKNRVSPQ